MTGKNARARGDGACEGAPADLVDTGQVHAALVHEPVLDLRESFQSRLLAEGALKASLRTRHGGDDTWAPIRGEPLHQ